MAIREVLNRMKNQTPIYHNSSFASFRDGKGLETNLSSFFTALIREAAKCNHYSSDVIYDIDNIRHAMEDFTPGDDFPIIMVGFRKMGVDGNGYILARTEENPYNINKEYFAVASMEITLVDGYDDWWKVDCNIWHV